MGGGSTGRRNRASHANRERSPRAALQGKALHATEVRETERNREKSGKTSWGPSGKNTTQPWMVFLCVRVCTHLHTRHVELRVHLVGAGSLLPGIKLKPSGFGSKRLCLLSHSTGPKTRGDSFYVAGQGKSSEASIIVHIVSLFRKEPGNIQFQTISALPPRSSGKFVKPARETAVLPRRSLRPLTVTAASLPTLVTRLLRMPCSSQAAPGPSYLLLKMISVHYCLSSK